MATKDTTHQLCSEQLVQLLPLLARLLRRGIRQTDPLLSPPHVRILDFLARNSGASLSELSCELDITNATASSHIDKLVKRRLVQRDENPSERRRVILTLTAEGKRSLEVAKASSIKILVEVMAPLTAAKLEQIYQGLVLLDEATKRFNEAQAKKSTVEE